MKKTIKLTESDLTNIINKVIFETYSEKDMERGEKLSGSKFGIDIKGEKDFRRDKMIIKKLVRLKSRIDDPSLKEELDRILDMLEQSSSL